MNMSTVTPPEGELLELIESLGSLAWRRYQQRYPLTWIDNKFQTADRSAFPPTTSFRFEKEDKAVISLIKNALENYKGNIEWVLGEHKRINLPGTNWVICPKRFWEILSTSLQTGISANEYMAKNEPSFGPMAYADLISLTAYLRTVVSTVVPSPPSPHGH
jgi:hypothetical protein